MRYGRGSHLQGTLPHRFSSSDLEAITQGEEIAVEIDEAVGGSIGTGVLQAAGLPRLP
ncbi:hypothetical protein [Streptomyces sp. NPDC002587]